VGAFERVRLIIRIVPMETVVKPTAEAIKNWFIRWKSYYKAFTLLEILVVILILSVFFSTLTFLFKNSFDSAVGLLEKNSKLQRDINIFWQLTRAIYGAKRLILRNGTDLYLITTGGLFYPGVVKSVYLYKNGTLYYYEFPYPYGPLESYNSSELKTLGRFDKFALWAVYGGRESKDDDGRATLFKLILDNQTFYLKRFK
jgi:prepilin-type N-terminal cleavage/methylation domain-containing protein